jgi:hypothetical protein
MISNARASSMATVLYPLAIGPVMTMTTPRVWSGSGLWSSQRPNATVALVSGERASNHRKAYRFLRAFVLWFALLYAIILVAYVTLVPWLVQLATRSP